jgi:hypothetical protein
MWRIPIASTRLFAKRLVDEKWFDDFDSAFAAAKNLDAQDIAANYEAAMSSLNECLRDTMRHSGVTCFSSKRNDQRLWATYGQNHSGAVIEFTTDRQVSRFSSHLSPVAYTDTKLPLCPSEFFTNSLEIDQWLLSVCFCIKHLDWRDEHEWRLLLLANREQSQRDRTVPFERAAITRVFLGPRISPEGESRIRAAATSHAEEVPVFKRRIDEELAYEEYVGFEIIHSIEQLKYWMRFDRLPDRATNNALPKPTRKAINAVEYEADEEEAVSASSEAILKPPSAAKERKLYEEQRQAIVDAENLKKEVNATIRAKQFELQMKLRLRLRSTRGTISTSSWAQTTFRLVTANRGSSRREGGQLIKCWAIPMRTLSQ